MTAAVLRKKEIPRCKQKTSRLLVLKRTLPTELQPLVGEVGRVERCRVVSATGPYGRESLVYRPEPLLFFYSRSSSIIHTRLIGSHSTPTTSLVALIIEPGTSRPVARKLEA
jgi:hypothetical protein